MKISIVTPTFNRESVLARCIESVASQSYCNYEHVIIDDGSSDNTINVIEEYKKNESCNIVFIQLKNNRGVNFARNRGCEAATGDYILFLDSDDYLISDALILVEDYLTKFADIKHFVFRVSDRNNDDSISTGNRHFFYKDWLGGKVHGDFTHIVKRDIIINNKFFEQFSGFESLNMLRIYKQSSPQLFIDETICKIERNRYDSLSLTIKNEIEKNKKILFNYNKKFLQIYSIDLIRYAYFKKLVSHFIKMTYYYFSKR